MTALSTVSVDRPSIASIVSEFAFGADTFCRSKQPIDEQFKMVDSEIGYSSVAGSRSLFNWLTTHKLIPESYSLQSLLEPIKKEERKST